MVLILAFVQVVVITQPAIAVTMVCLYLKVISVQKAQRTGRQQVGENITDGGTMLMKRAGKKMFKKQKKKRKGREGLGEGRPGSERR